MKSKIQADPIIAVRDLRASGEWYETLLGCKDVHGGDHFKILTDDNGAVLLCLHPWGRDEHPTMMDRSITPGNGLILYFRVENLKQIRNNAEKLNTSLDADIHTNSNTRRSEFSLRDLDGYYVIVTEYHEYEG